MKLSVIALDYDGTTARHDSMGPLVREAIAAARARGIVVLLVTGRILDELRRVAGDLRFVDGVVAENGAVLHFPDTGHTTLLAPGVVGGFLEELRRRSVPHQAGQCLVDADANEAPGLLNLIRALELPLVLIFNGGRVMTLSQGVSKATGLHAMLETLRRSAHNTLAIGDAENDHELLRLAEVGAAVEWGSTALRAVADTVVPGSGPPAVAEYIDDHARAGRLPTPARERRRLRLGYTEDEREFSLGVKGRNVLVAGDAMSGKSWVAGLLCEQLILHGYCVCVIDPEGDYGSLEALPGVSLLGGDDPPPSTRELLRALRYPDRSIVIDLSRRKQDEKIEYIRNILPLLNGARRRTGLPHRIVVDEAHYFLHDATARHLLDLGERIYVRDLLRVAPAAGTAAGNRGHDRHSRIGPRRDRCAAPVVPPVQRGRRGPLVPSDPARHRAGRRTAGHRGVGRRADPVHARPAPDAARPSSREIRRHASERRPGLRLRRECPSRATGRSHPARFRERVEEPAGLRRISSAR